MNSSKNRSGSPLATVTAVDGVAMLVPLGLILLLMAFLLLNSYQSAVRAAQSNVDTLADVLALNITSTLDRLHGNLDSVAADIVPADLRAPLSPQRRQQLESRLTAALNGFDPVINHRIFDANGMSILGVGRANPQIRVNVADRRWFQMLKQQPDTDFILSEVMVSKATGRYGMFFGRPLRDESGALVGAINGHIDLDWFQTMIDNLDIGAEGLVTIRHRADARLIVRRPRVEAQLNASQTGLLDLHLSSVSRASGTFRSAIDGLDRLYAFRGLGRYPLSLVVAVSPNDYLRTWKVQTMISAAVALLLGAIQITAYRRLRQAYRTSVGMAHELEMTNTSLKRSNAELEEFAYIASHDLQTPLRNISCFSQLLERRCGTRLDGDCTEFLTFIASNAQRMSGLIHDLLAYARIGRQHMEDGPTAAAEAVALAIKDHESAIADCDAHIQVGELPFVAINLNHLTSLFSNLLSNALKYRSPDRPTEIAISATPDDHDQWRFAVTDNGIGIAPEYWEKIFTIFQRLHTVEEYEGSGIGLALCRRIVHHWGGEIWLTSRPHEGTTFYFTLPGLPLSLAGQAAPEDGTAV